MASNKHSTYRFTVDQTRADGIVQTFDVGDDGTVIRVSESAENIHTGYVPREHWDRIDPRALEEMGIKRYTEAVERCHGYTLEILDDASMAVKRDEDHFRWLRHHATLQADAFLQNKVADPEQLTVNVYHPNGKQLLRRFDVNGLWILNDFQQKIVERVAHVTGCDFDTAREAVCHLPNKQSLHPWVPEEALRKLENDDELKTMGISVSFKNNTLYFDYSKPRTI